MFPIFFALFGTALAGTASTAVDYDAAAKAARETLRTLVEADTTNPPGLEERAVELFAKKLDDAGITYEISDFAPRRKNIVARLKGDGTEPPVLLISHSDVVGAAGQSWTVDPHKLTEKDGFLYGRGVFDVLGMGAVNLEALLLLKRQGVALKRDVILALTGDEESSGTGVQQILKDHPEWLRAGIAFNEVGGPMLGPDGKVNFVALQTAEKLYQNFELKTHGTTGHSSVPLADNAITRLATALARLGHHVFPARLLPVTRAYLESRAAVEPPRLAAAMRAAVRAKGAIPASALRVLEADPIMSANLRTTCVATLVGGGTRVNALPAEATANINCRILPDETPEQVQAQLERVIGDRQVELKSISDFGHAEPSPLQSADLERVRATIHELWPNVPIGPLLSRGATDSRYLRAAGIPSYGLNPIPVSEEDARRAHGIDERIPAGGLRTGVEFFHRLLLKLAAKP